MSIDYDAISEENLYGYGTKINKWAPELLANLYHDRTHFVFELLQNAEDALRRRTGAGSRAVSFSLLQGGLKVSHFGKPFDELDVRGICGIDESTKSIDLTAIGRFGIGFKSVYAYTDRPEIHSDGEHFAIESFVRPIEITPKATQVGETVFWLPFKVSDDKAFDEIAEGLANLSPNTLLFLREVEEVTWSVEGGASGNYYRDTIDVNQQIRRVILLGQREGQQDIETEEWLVFSRPVYFDSLEVGAAEIAFALDTAANPDETKIKSVSGSRLVAFFPTIVPTNLGFLLQAPYRTTPGRDNVPPKDPWNQHLVEESASLLVESLNELEGRASLSVDVLCTLPLNKADFAEGSMFEPIYQNVAKALRSQPLLPTNETSWVTSGRAALARGQGLRELVDSHQLSNVISAETPLEWLSGDITRDRTPALRSYLISEHKVKEIQPEIFLDRVTKKFLEAQSDEWISRLYRFLLEQPTLLKNTVIANKPWVRLEDGTHTVAYTGDLPNAFLPSGGVSGFPTVKASVCTDQDALQFLKNLKLTEPEPVDDIIANVLPLYTGDSGCQHDLDLYREHIKAVEKAYSTPLRNQRTKLVTALKNCYFVPAIDNDGNKSWLRPFDCYLPTDRLKKLFAGVSGIDFVDDSVSGLQGETIRDILIACGAARYLDTVTPERKLSLTERKELRTRWGDARSSGGEEENDRTLWGLEPLLDFIGTLSFDEAAARSFLLWDALCDVIQDKRQSVVKATYSWSYYSRREMEHDAAFIRTLRNTNWVPTPDGFLATPTEVVFEHIQPPWTTNAVLQNALRFKPPLVDLLAKEIGLEPGLLHLLKKSGLTSEAQLRELLGTIENDVPKPEPHNEQTPSIKNDLVAKNTDLSSNDVRDEPKLTPGSSPDTSDGSKVPANGQHSGSNTNSAKSKAGQRTFISYLAANFLDEADEDVSDSETQQERMRVEAVAIQLILTLEPDLKQTPPGNPGFDLYGIGSDQQPNRWIEVKAMVGTLSNHPVGMSRRQFLEAQKRETGYWLYIVESATSDEPHILKIQDPVGKAKTFTFDQGWRDIATVSGRVGSTVEAEDK